ncbi:MAG: tyrosine-type recombinase/integrase [Carnobacterium sp.]|uniref:tyrosine-type recombinase/integrase n=1 Tax=Carnobacterium sp. TaxID=48221 RepID=UPI003315A49D
MVKTIRTKHQNIFKYETKKGIKYQIRFSTLINGVKKEFSKAGLNSITEAKSFYNDWIYKIENDLLTDLRSTKEFTLNEYYEKMKEFKLAASLWNANTLETNDYRFNKVVEPFGNKKLSEITRIDYQKWINDQYKIHDYSQETISGFHRVFMSVLNDAVAEDYLDKNRLLKVNLKKENYAPKKKIVNIEDYYTFMETAKTVLPNDTYTMLYLGTYGARRGEIYGVKINAIHFFEKDGVEIAQVDLFTSRTKRYKNGNKTKSKKGERIIIVDPYGAMLLRSQIDYSKEIKKNLNSIMHKDDFIFIDVESGKPVHMDKMNDAMKIVSNECGIKMHPHMLRHLFASASDIVGVDGESLRAFMGHEDEAMTNHYTHATKESAIKIMEQTSSILHPNRQ